MPTAKSAATSQPNTHAIESRRPRRLHRLAQIGAGLAVGLTVLVPMSTLSAPTVAAGASPNCPGWNSTTRPPDYIRVLRRQSGRVDRVPFKKYVLTVLGKEWPGYLPQQVINAGAVAVKQYGWYHTLGNGRMSARGQCFDVTDGVGDQLYKPGKARIRQDHYTAIAATWGVSLRKSGSLFMTGYRTGTKGACGYDATGWKLYARSATRCAMRGDGFMQILRIYYGPVAFSSSSTAAMSADSVAVSFDTTSGTDTTTVAPSTDTSGLPLMFDLPASVPAELPATTVTTADYVPASTTTLPGTVPTQAAPALDGSSLPADLIPMS